jgi:hypothetical protein
LENIYGTIGKAGDDSGLNLPSVPRDVAELLRVMATKICSVNFRIDEKECTLIYSFAKSVPDLKEEPSDPMLVLAD